MRTRFNLRKNTWLPLVGAFGLAACQPGEPGGASGEGPGAAAAEDAPAPWLVEAATDRGLDFLHVSGAGPDFAMPEIMGGGVGLIDVEDDGDWDLYLVQSGRLADAGTPANPANALFLNDGQGHFAQVPDSGAEDTGYGMGVAVGDLDGDARDDLLVTNVGPNGVYLNLGDGRFAPGPESAAQDPRWGTSAALADTDRDGDLDLYVCHYLAWRANNELVCKNEMGGRDYCSPNTYDAPALDGYYLNDGTGRFTEVGPERGIDEPSNGLGVCAFDQDDDGDLDFFVANDGRADFLWINDGGGAFEDRAKRYGAAVDSEGMAKAGMGVAVADLDGDLDLDLLVGNLRRESDSLFLNEGGERFKDGTRRIGLGVASRPFTRFGLGFCDLDADGHPELFQTNGRVMQQGTGFSDDPYAEPDLLWRGLDGPRFEPLDLDEAFSDTRAFTGRAAAFGDLDGDGRPDWVVVNRDGPAQLWLNRAEQVGRRLAFDLREAGGRRSHGARVELALPSGSRRADALPSGSYLASKTTHALLSWSGDAPAVWQPREIWEDGTVERFTIEAPSGTAAIALRRGQGTFE
ncbi:MAG: FG-GAP repeat domain-containing protein [Planctomycetota bacterium]